MGKKRGGGEREGVKRFQLRLTFQFVHHAELWGGWLRARMILGENVSLQNACQ